MVLDPSRWSWRATLGAALALAAGTLGLYAQVAGFEFIRFDDSRYVTDNLVVQRGLSWDGVAWAFGSLHASNWHPLTWLSHMLDVELFGLDPGAHHAVSAALHSVNAALLFLVLARMTGARGRSLLVAALFAVHPLHVESVAWVAERKDVLSTLFGLLALGAWTRYAERLRPGPYLAVVVAFAASLLAKPMWVTLPFLLLLLDLWPLGRIAGLSPPPPEGAPGLPAVPLRRALAEKLPLLLLAAASSAVTVVAQRRGGSLAGLELDLATRVGNAAAAYVRYVALTLWPTDLAVFYPFAPVSPWAAVAAALGVAAVTALALASARRLPWLAVGWCWFLGTLVPVIGIVQVGGQALADRYTYLPATGLFVAGVWGAHRIAGGWGRGVPLVAAAAVVVGVLSGATHAQLGHWATNEKLFRHALAVTSGNGLAHSALAEGLGASGRLEEALDHAEQAIRLEPLQSRHWTNRAIFLLGLRRAREARDAALRSVDLNPSNLFAWTSLGIAEQDLGDLAQAEAAFVRATELAPHNAKVWFGLGEIRSQAGRRAEAAAAYEEAVRIAPNHFRAWTNLAENHRSAGRAADAARAFEAAVRADPGNPVGWRNLAAFHLSAGEPAQAISELRNALRLRPRDPDLLLRLGAAQLAAGARAEALATAAELEAVAPPLAAELRARAGP